MHKAFRFHETVSAAQTLIREKDRIVTLFVERCREAVVASQKLDAPVLAEHLPEFIEEISKRLKYRSSAILSPQAMSEQAELHAEVRARTPRFRLPELLNEYRIFRGIVFEILDRRISPSPWERNIINSMIDQRLLEVATRYAKWVQDRELEESRAQSRLHDILQMEQARSEAIIRHMPAALIIGEAPSGKLILGNSARMREIWGHDLIPSDDISGYSAWEGWHLDGRKISPDEWPLARAIRNGEEVKGEVIAIRWPSGEKRFLRLSASPVRDRNGKITAGIVICEDITELRETIEALSLSEERYRTIFERAPIGIAELAPDKRIILRANPTYCRMLGYSEEELIGKSVIELTHPEDREADHHIAKELHEGRRALYQLEKRYRRRDGGLFWARVNATIISDTDGRPGRIIAIVQDIDDQKSRETELRQAIRIREETLAVVSHDLRNPLSTITMLASLIARDRTEARPESPLHDAARRILKAADRMNRLIQDVLDIARLESGTYSHAPRPCHSGELIDEVIEIMKPLASEKSIQLRAHGDGTSPQISCDRDGMIRVFVNLISNSIKFTAPGGKIEIGLESAPPGHVTFSVRDNGRGIAPKDMTKIFNRFYQSDSGETRRLGTGLGLAIVKAIIEAHSGRVKVESVLGKGSTFTIILPTIDQALQSPLKRAAG